MPTVKTIFEHLHPDMTKWIEFLVWRKFPGCFPVSGLGSRSSTVRKPYQNQRLKQSPQYLQSLRYEMMLFESSADEVESLYEAEISKYNEELENERFHQPEDLADLHIWYEKDNWSLEEAVALSMGKKPGYIHWNNIKDYVNDSKFAAEYCRRRDLVRRARDAGNLNDPAAPDDFIAWTKSKAIALPSILNQLTSSADQTETVLADRWEDVAVTLRFNDRIQFSSENNKLMFGGVELGLLDRRQGTPVKHYGVLIGLAAKLKFPSTPEVRNDSDSQVITKLRAVLKKCTGIESDPFFPYNKSDGWKPRFKLVDMRDSSDKRAKQKAVHHPLDEGRHYPSQQDYEDEDDAAGNFLRNTQETSGR